MILRAIYFLDPKQQPFMLMQTPPDRNRGA